MKTNTLRALLLLSAIGIIISGQPLLGQNELKPVLNAEDIDRFLNTFEPMMSEFESLPEEFEEDEDWEDMTYETVLKSFESGLENDKVVAILTKYGWAKSTYGKKLMAISMGTGYLIVLSRIDEMPEAQGKEIADIYNKQYKSLVHENDLKLLKPRLPELELIFAEE